MSTDFFLLAYAKPEELFPKGHFLDPTTKEGLIVIAATGLVALLVMAAIVFYYTRRSRRRHHPHRHHHHHTEHHHRPDTQPSHQPDAEKELGEENEDGTVLHKRRRRRRKREHRPRNPTLAETGGLPPVRTDAPPGP